MRKVRTGISELLDNIIGQAADEERDKQLDEISVKATDEDFAELMLLTYEFFERDKDFHLAVVKGNKVAEPFLAILVDRLRLDLRTTQRIKRRVIGNAAKLIGSIVEHECIIAKLEGRDLVFDGEEDNRTVAQLIDDHIRDR